MNRNQQDKLDQNHISFGLSLDALAGSGLTEDEETTATSSPVEAVRSGGIWSISSMALDHFQDAAVDFSILTSLQTFQILQRCTNTIEKQSF